MVVVVVNKGIIQTLDTKDVSARDIEEQGMRVLGYFNYTPCGCQMQLLLLNYLGGEA